MTQTTHLTLELQQQDDLISGRITGAHGSETFTGWLELMAALDALAAGSAGPGTSLQTEEDSQ